MCQLKGSSNGTYFRSIFYVCWGFHFLMVCLYSLALDEGAAIFFGVVELYMITIALIGLRKNFPVCFLVMLAYQIITAGFTSALVIAALIYLEYTACLIVCVLLTFQIYFIKISIKLYYEMNVKIGHVVSSPQITEGSNCLPHVILHQPQTTYVPSSSNAVYLVQPNTADHAQIPNHDYSYLPDSIQPAFNPAFISSSNPIFRN